MKSLMVFVSFAATIAAVSSMYINQGPFGQTISGPFGHLQQGLQGQIIEDGYGGYVIQGPWGKAIYSDGTWIRQGLGVTEIWDPETLSWIVRTPLGQLVSTPTGTVGHGVILV